MEWCAATFDPAGVDSAHGSAFRGPGSGAVLLGEMAWGWRGVGAACALLRFADPSGVEGGSLGGGFLEGLFVAEFYSADFSADGFGEFGDELDDSRVFVGSGDGFDVILETFGQRVVAGRAGAQDHEGFHD